MAQREVGLVNALGGKDDEEGEAEGTGQVGDGCIVDSPSLDDCHRAGPEQSCQGKRGAVQGQETNLPPKGQVVEFTFLTKGQEIFSPDLADHGD